MSLAEWSDPKLANEYSEKAANPEHSWYEYEVNVPSMFLLMPDDAEVILDFGCGAGDVTAMLADKYRLVEGCDPSPSMLDIAKKDFPDLAFFDWDATTSLTDKQGYYDAIFSKLALHFVDDLHPVAAQLLDILKPGGSLVFSVPHPMSTTRKIADSNYWQQTPYPTQIGSYGIQVTMIHRSLQDYITPFVNKGFILTAFVEPRISSEIADKYDTSESDLAIPKRINVRLSKPQEAQL
jgi:trans-aconitate methyltransferase